MMNISIYRCGSRSSLAVKSTENSMNEFFLTSMDCTGAADDGMMSTSTESRFGHRDVARYLSRLQKCRDLIDASKQLVHELTTKPSKTRRHVTTDDLRQVDIKLQQYEMEIDQQIELFETSLVKNDKLDADLDGLSRRLADLARSLNVGAGVVHEDELARRSNLEERIEEVREELAQIEAVRNEIGRVNHEKSCLLDLTSDAKNLSQSRVQARLLEGFNETVLDLEAKKDKEITVRLGRMNNELNSMRDRCEQRLNELIARRYSKVFFFAFFLNDFSLNITKNDFK